MNGRKSFSIHFFKSVWGGGSILGRLAWKLYLCIYLFFKGLLKILI